MVTLDLGFFVPAPLDGFVPHILLSAPLLLLSAALAVFSAATASLLVSLTSFYPAILTFWFKSSTLKTTFAFKALNTLRIVSIVTFVVLFSSFDIWAL